MKRGKTAKEIVEYSSGDMVTINDLYKDDPKALSELAEMRKWMDDNPFVFDTPKEKISQGQKKMKQLLEDARRDSIFENNLKKIVKSEPSYTHDDLKPLYTLYRVYLDAMESFRKKYLHKNKSYNLKRKLCKEYGINPILFDRLIVAHKNNKLEGWDFSEETSGDVCIIENQEESDLPVDMHTYHATILEGIDKDVYPLNLKIHRFASKRDVLDFVETHWDQLKPYLFEKRIKQRKLPREIVDFIWKHRDKKAKGIIPILKEKHPKANLAYFEINKILSEEKKRRKIK